MSAFPNPLFVACPPLQTFFIDKDTGLPLVQGLVSFFEDANRTSLKPIYTISGVAPNYQFVQIDNPITLSAVGTFQYHNQDIEVYLYPYDSEGNISLYYVTVTSALGVPQFTRQGWPPFELEDIQAIPQDEQVNFIPNGQFLAHFIVPSTSLTTAGTITQPITNIAPGGFTFERPSGSTATDIITFNRFGSYTEFPTGSPRYEVQVQCTSANPADSFKYLGCKFLDVNKFASDTQPYTFFFEAQSLTGDFDIGISIVKNFGTGGSPSSPVVIPISTITLTPNRTNYNVNIIFGTNTNFSIGTNDDDYVQIVFALPTANTFGFTSTDWVLFEGEQAIVSFPVTTTADFLTRGIAGWMPIPDPLGSQLYLPLIQTHSGLTYDSSEIGKIYLTAYTGASPNSNELICDGSQFKTSAYSSLGIPYSRLQNKLFLSDPFNFPLYGTGSSYLTAYIQEGFPDGLRIVTNQQGLQPFTTTASVPFLVNQTHLGQTGIGLSAYITSAGQIYFKNINAGTVTNPTSGTMAVFSSLVIENNSAVQAQIIISSGAPVNPSSYFTFSTIVGNFYGWFTVDSVGSDPTPGGAGIPINILSSYSTTEINYIIKDSINGYQITNLQMTAGNTITPGGYISVYALSQQYIIWYTVDGIGSIPGVPGAYPIEVDVLSTDSASIVALKTQIAINMQFFAIPNLNNLFPRIKNNTSSLSNNDLRVNALSSIGLTTALGSFQDFAVQSHNHSGNVTIHGVSNTGAQNPFTIQFLQQSLSPTPQSQVESLNINYYGLTETRPENLYLNAVIKY